MKTVRFDDLDITLGFARDNYSNGNTAIDMYTVDGGRFVEIYDSLTINLVGVKLSDGCVAIKSSTPKEVVVWLINEGYMKKSDVIASGYYIYQLSKEFLTRVVA